jgi:peptidoglycan/LPS O-acetylase OafA/YrhL
MLMTRSQTGREVRGDGTPSAVASPAPPEQPLPTLRGHMPALDGVRGLAILMVLLLHFVANTTATTRMETWVAKVLTYGLYGVDLFFVLSGFLITGILCDARGKPHFFRNFYVRRVLRIFPLYYVVLFGLFFVLPRLLATPSPVLEKLRDHQAWAWLYGVNIFLSREQSWTALPYIGHFWSLAVEEHFYLFWPLAVWALAPWPKVLMGTSAFLALGAMAARIVASVAGVDHVTTTVLTPFRLDGLALGGFIAVAARQPGGVAAIVRWLPRVTAAVGVLIVTSSVWVHGAQDGRLLGRPIRNALILLLLACLMLWALTVRRSGLVPRFFTSKPMVFLGTYSYGIYVYHHFLSEYFLEHGTEFALARRLGSHSLAVALQATFGIAVSLLVAYASYHVFEKHFLKLKERFGSRG